MSIWRPVGRALVFVVLCAGGCSGKKQREGSKETAAADPAASASTTAKAASTPPSTRTPATSEDVAFLRAECLKNGFAESACDCAAGKAQEMLPRELLVRMADAPSEDDPKLVGYFEAAELRDAMQWIDVADTECGLAEEDVSLDEARPEGESPAANEGAKP